MRTNGHHGQFCSIARALELLGGRWTLLVVREILCGSRRFNDIRRGIPRISKTVLSERLNGLFDAGVIKRFDGKCGPEYSLTDSGVELSQLLGDMATWGQRWLPRRTEEENLDLDPILVDMQRRVRLELLPGQPIVVRFDVRNQKRRFLLLRREEVSLCTRNPGFPEPLCITADLPVLAGWWRGDFGFVEAQRRGLTLEGSRGVARAFPSWFMRYQFAEVAAMQRLDRSSARARIAAESSGSKSKTAKAHVLSGQ